jgi:flagellar basal-body rod protein FlgF
MLENTMLIGLSRQTALLRDMDVIANNVANINTNGFKADSAIFEEYLMPVARANNFRPPDNFLSYVQDRGTWIDFSGGSVQQTSNPLDLVIDGDAYFVVQTARGQRYTRNGSFKINPQGEIVTSEGDRVLGDGGPIVIQQDDRSVNINPEGTVSVQSGTDTTQDVTRGKLRLVRFAQPQLLRKDGASSFAAPDGVQPGPPGRARVVQGAIEHSNVKPVVEMTRMIEVNRTYALIAGLMQNQSDLRKSAIQQLSEVPT